MLLQKTYIALLMLGIFTLSGCKVNSVYDVYSADMLEVIEKNVALVTPGQVLIEVSDCEENIYNIMEIASKYYEVVSEATCTSKEMDDFVKFSTEAPLVPYGQSLSGNSPTGLAVRQNSATEFELLAIIEKSRFAEMEAEVKEMDSSASLEINLVTVLFYNDLRDNIQVKTPSAWINNSPQTVGNVILKRRQKAEIVLSNVFSSTLGSKGLASVGKMEIQ